MDMQTNDEIEHAQWTIRTRWLEPFKLQKAKGHTMSLGCQHMERGGRSFYSVSTVARF